MQRTTSYLYGMASAAPEPTLDIREQIARIDKMQAELNRIQVGVVEAQVEVRKTEADVRKTEQDTRHGPLMLIFTGMGAAAAFFAAGAAFTKLIAG